MKLETIEYIYLAEKALSLFGMAPAVWLLVQLHELGATSFYTLPSKHTTHISLASQGSSSTPLSPITHSPRGATKEMPRADSSSQDAGKSSGMGSVKGEVEHHDSADVDWLLASRTVKLAGLSVDMAIVVVLSWAAQLGQLEEACNVVKDDEITFVLGK